MVLAEHKSLEHLCRALPVVVKLIFLTPQSFYGQLWLLGLKCFRRRVK